MSGATLFSGRYGSTEQYSRWIGEETSLPVFRFDDPGVDPTAYDFLVLGSSVIFYKATIRKWVAKHWDDLKGRPVLLFTVSGAAPGPKLDGWMADCFPHEVLDHVKHVALRGRLRHEDVSWWLRVMLKIGGLMNRDPEAREDEMHGFDYMDRSTIAPIVAWIRAQPAASG